MMLVTAIFAEVENLGFKEKRRLGFRVYATCSINRRLHFFFGISTSTWGRMGSDIKENSVTYLFFLFFFNLIEM